MIPKAKRKDKQKGAPPSALTTDAASSIPQKNLFWGPSAPGAPRQMENGGSSHDEGAPRASRRRSRRLRDKRQAFEPASSPLSALAPTVAASGAETGDEACVLVPLKQARALLASASPAAIQLAAAAAKPLPQVAPQNRYCATGGRGPWGPPHFEDIGGEVPPVESPHAETIVALRPPHSSTHPFRHPSMALASLPASRLPTLSHGGHPVVDPAVPPRVASFPQGFPAKDHPARHLQQHVEGPPALSRGPQGGGGASRGGPYPLRLPGRRSSDDPFACGSSLTGHTGPLPSLKDQLYYRLAGGPPRGPQGTAGPRTPERLHEHLAAEGRSYTTDAAGAIPKAPVDVPQKGVSSYCFREQGPLGGPPRPQWREPERQALRAPAPHFGALRDPPDTPAAAAVLHLEGPPTTASRQAASAEMALELRQRPQATSGLLASGEPPRENDISRELTSSSSLPFQRGMMNGATSGAASGLRMALPTFDALAAVLAPPPPEDRGPSRDSSAARNKDLKTKGRVSVSGVFLDAAFPAARTPPADFQTIPLERHGPPRQALLAVASAAAKDTLEALKKGGRIVLRLPWAEGGSSPSEKTPQAADIANRTCAVNKDPKAPVGVPPPPTPQHTPESLRRSERNHFPSLPIRLYIRHNPFTSGDFSLPPWLLLTGSAKLSVYLCILPSAPLLEALPASGLASVSLQQQSPPSNASGERESTIATAGEAVTAAADFLGQVLAATLDAWRLSLLEKRNSHQISPAKADALGAIAEVAAGLALEQLQKRSRSLRMAFEDTQRTRLENTERQRNERLAQESKGAALTAFLSGSPMPLFYLLFAHTRAIPTHTCARRRTERWCLHWRALHGATCARLRDLAAAEKMLRSLSADADSSEKNVVVPQSEGRQEEAEIRVAPRTVQQLQADCIAAAEATGQLSIVSQSALATHRKQLRKIESQVSFMRGESGEFQISRLAMVLRANQALRLLEVLEQKKRQLLGSAALFHRCVMPETDEKTVLSRLQKFQLHAERIPVDEVENEVNGAQRSRGRGGFGGSVRAPRRSSLECRLSDCSLFTASYPHSQEDFRFSLSSLLNDSPSSLKATTPPEGTLAEGPLEESLPVAPQERPLEADTPQDAAREARTIHSRTQETACLFEQPQIQGVDHPEHDRLQHLRTGYTPFCLFFYTHKTRILVAIMFAPRQCPSRAKNKRFSRKL
ncbi:hypothetical protein cyc_01907 [Cyclospora cayetanensis]|uniref:Uncharacterized protein n=1 Tax=Cyclospora cayetanensis TaxID=88456 RepID=A0A1D3CSR7_9EIME|nr:hypothetical protein cyc_01907 [Cyclospora cayetanensis]